MANRMTRVAEVEATAETSVVEKKTTAKAKKVFSQSDMIPCRSICNGEFLMVGDKTKDLYSWADYGSVEYVAYNDLKYLCDRRNSVITLPRIIVDDDEFIEQNAMLSNIYDNMYTVGDLRDIVSLPNSQMKRVIEELPKGAFDSLKGVVATMIDRKELDSVEKIKALDEILDTQLLLALARY